MLISSVFDARPDEWERQLEGMLQFLRRYGERRLTAEGFVRLAALVPGDLALPGTSLLTVSVRGQFGRQLAGVSFVQDYGRGACLVAVHPLYRGRNLGAALLSSQLRRLGRLECKVACDNTASLKACFLAGMTAVGLQKGPKGRPVLRFISTGDAGSARLPQQADSAAPTPFQYKQEGDRLCENPY